MCINNEISRLIGDAVNELRVSVVYYLADEVRERKKCLNYIVCASSRGVCIVRGRVGCYKQFLLSVYVLIFSIVHIRTLYIQEESSEILIIISINLQRYFQINKCQSQSSLFLSCLRSSKRSKRVINRKQQSSNSFYTMHQLGIPHDTRVFSMVIVNCLLRQLFFFFSRSARLHTCVHE